MLKTCFPQTYCTFHMLLSQLPLRIWQCKRANVLGHLILSCCPIFAKVYNHKGLKRWRLCFIHQINTKTVNSNTFFGKTKTTTVKVSVRNIILKEIIYFWIVRVLPFMATTVFIDCSKRRTQSIEEGTVEVKYKWIQHIYGHLKIDLLFYMICISYCKTIDTDWPMVLKLRNSYLHDRCTDPLCKPDRRRFLCGHYKSNQKSNALCMSFFVATDSLMCWQLLLLLIQFFHCLFRNEWPLSLSKVVKNMNLSFIGMTGVLHFFGSSERESKRHMAVLLSKKLL